MRVLAHLCLPDEMSSASTRIYVCVQRFNHIDCLINNAGVFAAGEREETKEGYELTYGINVQALYLVTCLLLKKVGVCCRGSLSAVQPPSALTQQQFSDSAFVMVVTAAPLQTMRALFCVVTPCFQTKQT